MQQELSQEFEFLTLEEAGELLGCNVATIREAIRSGELTATTYGKGYRVTKSWLQAWIDRKTINPEMATSGK